MTAPHHVAVVGPGPAAHRLVGRLRAPGHRGPVTVLGETFRYDRLVLATGAPPRIPQLPGVLTADGRPTEGATTLRTPDDAERLADGPVVVLGGGDRRLRTADPRIHARGECAEFGGEVPGLVGTGGNSP